MKTLAEQIKEELTERAKNSESCKKYLLDWVMNKFREGQNPVIINCTSTSKCVSPELRERVIKEKCRHTEGYFDFIYRDGRHFVKGYNLMTGDGDYYDANALLQTVMFGEVVYG